jgi:hypothetical protein
MTDSQSGEALCHPDFAETPRVFTEAKSMAWWTITLSLKYLKFIYQESA